MPKDLLKPLNQDQVLDLIDYLMSRGNPDHLIFQEQRCQSRLLEAAQVS